MSSLCVDMAVFVILRHLELYFLRGVVRNRLTSVWISSRHQYHRRYGVAEAGSRSSYSILFTVLDKTSCKLTGYSMILTS